MGIVVLLVGAGETDVLRTGLNAILPLSTAWAELAKFYTCKIPECGALYKTLGLPAPTVSERWGLRHAFYSNSRWFLPPPREADPLSQQLEEDIKAWFSGARDEMVNRWAHDRIVRREL